MGVPVQPADVLHAAFSQGRCQQGVHAGMVLGLQRAFVASRLVQHDVGLFVIRPVLAVHGEHQPLGREVACRVVAKFAVDGDAFVVAHKAAQLAAAKALGVEDTFELHGIVSAD